MRPWVPLCCARRVRAALGVQHRPGSPGRRGSPEGQPEPLARRGALRPGPVGGGSARGSLPDRFLRTSPHTGDLGPSGAAWPRRTLGKCLSCSAPLPLKGGGEPGRQEEPVICSDPGSSQGPETSGGEGGRNGRDQLGPRTPEVSVRASSCPGEGQPGFPRASLATRTDAQQGGHCPPPPTIGFSTGLCCASKPQPAERPVARPDAVRLAALTCADSEPGSLGSSCCRPCPPELPTAPGHTPVGPIDLPLGPGRPQVFLPVGITWLRPSWRGCLQRSFP